MSMALATKRLAYRFFNNCGEEIVLLDVEAHAEYWHRVYVALRTAKTWEEFKTMMPADEYARIEAECRDAAQDAGNDAPQFSGPFSASEMSGYEDGDYPPFASAALDRIVPATLLEKYARRE